MLSPPSSVMYVRVLAPVWGGGRLIRPFSPNCGLSAILPVLRLIRNSLRLVAAASQVRPTSSVSVVRADSPSTSLSSCADFIPSGLSGPPPHRHSLSVPSGWRDLCYRFIRAPSTCTAQFICTSWVKGTRVRFVLPLFHFKAAFLPHFIRP